MTGNPLLLFLILWPLACSLLGFRLGKKNKRRRDYFSMFVTLIELGAAVWLLIQVAAGRLLPAEGGGLSFWTDQFFWQGILDRGLSLKIDGFRAVYAVIAGGMWFLTMLISREYFHHYRNRNRYHLFNLMTLSATVGVFLSADFFTTFVFFELMSFTSYVMVVNNEKPASLDAGGLYMAVAVIGGLVMLFGIQLLENRAGTLNFDALLASYGAGGGDRGPLLLPACLMLFGFGAKAGMFPLHIWLPAAHPAAPAPASALLSGILTKTGIFGVALIGVTLFLQDSLWGHIVLSLGTVTMFLGAFLAIFTMDLKRILACSSISQIVFMLVGCGMQGILGSHNALAVRGTFLHMVNHSLIKLALFMAAGALFMNLHQLELDQIKGFGRGKPALHAAFLAGALSIMGVPGFSGYLSKTLLHESIVEYIHLLQAAGANAIFYQSIEILFLFTGAMTAAYMLKIYWALFWEKNPRQAEFDKMNHTYLRKKGAAALLIAAALLLLLGFFPYRIAEPLADLGQGFFQGHAPEHEVHYYAWINLKGAVISLGLGLLLYFGFILPCLTRTKGQGKTRERIYLNRWPLWLDLDHLVYRPLFLRILPAVGEAFAQGAYVLSEKGFQLFGRDLLRFGAEAARRFYCFTDSFWDYFDLSSKEGEAQGGEKLPRQTEQGVSRFWTAILTMAGRIVNAFFELADRGLDRIIRFAVRKVYRLFPGSSARADRGRAWAEKKLAEEEKIAASASPRNKEQERAVWQAINGSLSYSLLLFGLGLIVAMLYLFIVN